jgi:ParB family chromosome partitioning protein
MPDEIHLIPLDAIAEDALARDRASLDAQALEELKTSITASGLRMPIEVYRRPEPDGARLFGLISGFRRLRAFRELHDMARDKTRFAAIPAFLRTPATLAEALTAMVEENAIRAEVSPWEQALIAVIARDNGVFDTLEAAIDALYAALSRDKRYRMRSIAHLAEELDGHLAAPETLSLRRLLRLAAATSRGYAGLMRHALTEAKLREPNAQWRVLAPILAECEDATIPDPRPERGHRDRPRRTYVTPRHALRIRREMTRGGWCLHFTGRDASGELIDRVFDEIEMLFSPG